MAIDTTAMISAANKLAERYGTEVNPKLVSSINSISTTNSKYQLPAGTEDDFNNAATFLVNATYKDSEAIDAAESDQSAAFGAKLLKYFNSELTQQDVFELAMFAKNYNDAITAKYPADPKSNEYKNLDDAGKRSYIKDVFGIDPDTFEIDEYGIAAAFRDSIVSQYASDGQLTDYDDAFIDMIVAYEIARQYFGAADDNESDAIDWKYAIESYSIADDAQTTSTPRKYALKTVADRESATSISTAAAMSALLGGMMTHAIGISVANPFFNGERAFLEYGRISDQTVIKGSSNDASNDQTVCYFEQTESKSEKVDVDWIQDGEYSNIAYVMNYGTTLSRLADGQNKKIIIASIGDTNDRTTYANQNDDGSISLSKTDGGAKPLEYANGTNGHVESSYGDQGIADDVKNAMLSVSIAQRKIYCDASYSAIQQGTSIDAISQTSKLCANSIETMNALSYGMPLILTVTNVPMATNSAAYKAIASTFGEAESKVKVGSSEYATVNFAMAYKEFNPEIRKIAGSALSDVVLSYLSASGIKLDSAITTRYSSAVGQLKKSSIPALNRMLGDTDVASIFNDLHSNPYMIRNAAADDLIAYYAGESISFGTTSSDEEDIETLISLYKSCRDYFYKVLMDKAFIHDEKYGMFVRYFIKYLTIDRFINARLDNAHEISKYTLNECEAFMDSYGLEELSDQIRSKYFQNATEYSKKIIANYADLMSYKGSRHDIDRCATLLDSDSTDLTLYKYTLAKDDSSNLRFVMTEYSAENMNHELTNSFSASADYSAFVADDQYWDADSITPYMVSRKMNSPQMTKYLGMSLSSDLYKDYITTQTSLAVNRFIDGKAPIEGGVNHVFGLSNFVSEMPSGTAFESIECSLDVKIAILQLMWKYYVRLSECLRIADVSAFSGISDDGDDEDGHKPSYFGINQKAMDLPDLFKELSINDDLGKMMLYKWNGTKYSPVDGYSLYMLGNVDGHGYPGISDMDVPKKRIGESMAHMIPVNAVSSVNVNSSKYAAFDNIFSEYHAAVGGLTGGTDISKHETSVYAFDCQITAVNDALEAASAICVINKLSAGSDGDAADRASIFKALYYYYKYGELGLNYNDIIDSYDISKDLAVTSYYEYLYSKIAKFAINYLTGEYIDSSGGGYDADVKRILDAVYSEYYTTDDVSDSAMMIIVGDYDSSAGGSYSVDADKLKSQLRYELGKINGSDNLEKALTDLRILKPESDGYAPIAYNRDFKSEETTLTASVGSAAENVTEAEASDIMADLLTNIGELSNHINEYFLAYDEQQIHMSSAEDTDNEFEFTKAMIRYFMSYTAYLYSASSTHEYDTKHERIEFAASVSDEIFNDVADHAFYDYDITIDESAELI